MPFTLNYTQATKEHLYALKKDPSKNRILKDVIKALRLMETNLRHPSLNTHEYRSLQGPNGEKIFESICTTKNFWSISYFLVLWTRKRYHFDCSYITPSLKN